MSNFYSLNKFKQKDLKELINNVSFFQGSKNAEKIDIVSINTSNFDIDAIVDKLSNGDKTALDALDKAGISYTYTEKNNGFNIQFSYNGVKYIINYVGSNNTTTGNVDNTGNTNSGTNEPEAPKDNIPPDYSNEFDYSDVPNLNNSISDMYDEKNVVGNWIRSIYSDKNPDIDSGAWDNLLESMSKVKNQLHSYIKAQLEARGIEYDKDLVESKLNQMITDVANLAVIKQTSGFIELVKKASDISSKDYELNTVKDCINLLFANVKNIFEPQNSDIVNIIGSSFKIREFDPKCPRYDAKVNLELVNTADYFLTDDQKKLKQIFRFLRNEGHFSISDKDGVKDYLRIYSEHMKKVLKQNYPHLSEYSIAYILDTCLNKITNSLKPDKTGMYNVTAAAETFAKECVKMAEAR